MLPLKNKPNILSLVHRRLPCLSAAKLMRLTHTQGRDELPTNSHIAFVITDCNGQSYVIGQHEKPRPIIKTSSATGTPSGDPAVCSVEVTLYAQKSLIPCNMVNNK